MIRPWLLKIQHGKPCHTFANLDVQVLEKCFRLVAFTYTSPKVDMTGSKLVPRKGGQIIGELFLASYFKASYFGELFLCKLDY